jgi:hypothetical protein
MVRVTTPVREVTPGGARQLSRLIEGPVITPMAVAPANRPEVMLPIWASTVFRRRG